MYVTQNTIKGYASDLVTDYLDSYIGIQKLVYKDKPKNIDTDTLVNSSVDEILSTIGTNVLRQLSNDKLNFLKEEIYRELIEVYSKDKNQVSL